MHTEYERWYEEDPEIKNMIVSQPIVLSGCDSRFEYDLNILLTGYMSMEYINTVKKLQSLGIANMSKYYTDSYLSNNNSNTNLDFILKSLK